VLLRDHGKVLRRRPTIGPFSGFVQMQPTAPTLCSFYNLSKNSLADTAPDDSPPCVQVPRLPLFHASVKHPCAPLRPELKIFPTWRSEVLHRRPLIFFRIPFSIVQVRPPSGGSPCGATVFSYVSRLLHLGALQLIDGIFFFTLRRWVWCSGSPRRHMTFRVLLLSPADLE